MNFNNTEINIDIHFNFSSQPCLFVFDKYCFLLQIASTDCVPILLVYCTISARRACVSWLNVWTLRSATTSDRMRPMAPVRKMSSSACSDLRRSVRAAAARQRNGRPRAPTFCYFFKKNTRHKALQRTNRAIAVIGT